MAKKTKNILPLNGDSSHLLEGISIHPKSNGVSNWNMTYNNFIKHMPNPLLAAPFHNGESHDTIRYHNMSYNDSKAKESNT